MNASIHGVECPHCGEPIEIRADISPGEPMVLYYPDGSGYPGSGPDLDDWAFSLECECEVEEDDLQAQVEEKFESGSFTIDGDD